MKKYDVEITKALALLVGILLIIMFVVRNIKPNTVESLPGAPQRVYPGRPCQLICNDEEIRVILL